MSEADDLFGEEHIRRYRETDGEVGHIWRRGSKILLLTTKGRNTGEPRTTPLIYEEAGDDYVIVASKGGAPEHPGWYRNLAKEPQVELQVKGEVFPRIHVPQPARSVRGSGSSRRNSGRTTTSIRRRPTEKSRSSCSRATDRHHGVGIVACRVCSQCRPLFVAAARVGSSRRCPRRPVPERACALRPGAMSFRVAAGLIS